MNRDESFITEKVTIVINRHSNNRVFTNDVINTVVDRFFIAGGYCVMNEENIDLLVNLINDCELYGPPESINRLPTIN